MFQTNVLCFWHTDEHDGEEEKEDGGKPPEGAVEAKDVLQVGKDLEHGEGQDRRDGPDESFAASASVVWEKL